MNKHPAPGFPAILRAAAIAGFVLGLSGCGGGDVIGSATPTSTRQAPEIRPVGFTPRSVERVPAAVTRAAPRAASSPQAGFDGAGVARLGDPLAGSPDELPDEPIASRASAATDPSPSAPPDAAPGDEASDDGSAVTPLSADLLRPPQTGSTAAWR